MRRRFLDYTNSRNKNGKSELKIFRLERSLQRRTVGRARYIMICWAIGERKRGRYLHGRRKEIVAGEDGSCGQ